MRHGTRQLSGERARHGAWHPATGLVLHRRVAGFYSAVDTHRVVQSDLFRDTETVAVLLMSSTLVDTPLTRVTVNPSDENRLRASSQVMVDKPVSVPVRKIGPVFGHLDAPSLLEVNRALALFLGVAD